MATEQNEKPRSAPYPALEHIMRCLPVQQRMGNCSLACRSLQEAAVAVTGAVQVHNISSQQRADALCAWLHKHGNNAMAHLDLEGVWGFDHPSAVIRLPWQQLLQLQSLRVRHLQLSMGRHRGTGVTTSSCSQPPASIAAETAAAAAAAAATAAAAAKSLSALTRLTSLQLSTFSTCSPSAIVCWTARQIAPLTSLHCLNLGFSGFAPRTHISSSAPSAALAAALGQLVQLTSLSLDSHLDGTALSTVSSLNQLQRLQLIDVGRIGSSEEPLKVQGFPSSLTHLRLLGCCIQGPDDGSSWRLPLLQELDMWDVQGFEPAVMADTQQLRWVKMGGEEMSDLNMECLLGCLESLQQLQHLELHNMKQKASAASFSELSASSSLTALLLLDCSIPAGAARHMFPLGRQLQRLQQLQIEPSDEAFDDYVEGSQGSDTMQLQSLVLDHGDLQRLVACCPNLQELSLIWPKDSSDAGVAGSDVRLLLQLKRLTSLSVGGPLWDNRAATEVLARLTGLQELYVVGSTELLLPGVRQLTRLTALATLCLSKCGVAFLCDVTGHDRPLSLNSKASPLDVWRQLQHKCDQMAAMQRW